MLCIHIFCSKFWTSVQILTDSELVNEPLDFHDPWASTRSIWSFVLLYFHSHCRHWPPFCFVVFEAQERTCDMLHLGKTPNPNSKKFPGFRVFSTSFDRVSSRPLSDSEAKLFTTVDSLIEFQYLFLAYCKRILSQVYYSTLLFVGAVDIHHGLFHFPNLLQAIGSCSWR